MKKIVLLITFLLLIQEDYAQSTLVFAPDSSKWTQHAGRECGGGGTYYFYNYTNYIINGDTLVNTKMYQKLYSAGTSAKIDTICYTFSRYVLNDSGVVYIGASLDSLKPIYNFNLAKGDSFPILAWNSSTLQSQIFYTKVDSTNTLLYAGKLRKWLRFQQLGCGVFMAKPTWIEGIGDINYGLIFDYVQQTNCNVGPCVPYSSYDCFYDGGNKSIVGACAYTNCTTQDIENFLSINELNIYPNPASNFIEVAVNNKQLANIKVFDVLGNELLQTQKKQIDISILPNGVYFVQIETNNSVMSKKIIVQH